MLSWQALRMLLSYFKARTVVYTLHLVAHCAWRYAVAKAEYLVSKHVIKLYAEAATIIQYDHYTVYKMPIVSSVSTIKHATKAELTIFGACSARRGLCWGVRI